MPKRLPENIERAVKRIRKEYGHYVEAKLLRGRYRLFQATSVYNPEKGRSDKITKYLGWLTEDGLLIPADHRDGRSKELREKERQEKERLAELEESIAEQEQKKAGEGIRKIETERHERNILRALSMDARITVPELAKVCSISKTAVSYHLKNLERRYDIGYILEINIEKFGYINYLAFAKFTDKRPAFDEMKQQLEGFPYVQVAMITKGAYDMIIFLVVEATSDARSTLYQLTQRAFPTYDIEWNMSPAYFRGPGFIPLRSDFFEVLKEKVWTRTREKPRPAHDEITEMEYKILGAMNKNAAADFATIDREIGAEKGRSNYAYHKLMERGIIQRATINMQNLNSRFDIVYIVGTINMKKWEPTREKLLLELIRESKNSEADRYPFACDIMSPKGTMIICHVFKGEDLEAITEDFGSKVGGSRISNLIVTDIIIGSVNNRFSDKTQMRQYELLMRYYNGYTPERIRKEIDWDRDIGQQA